MGAKDKQPLLIIAGPTAAGKTEISLVIAERLHGEILSCDSGQVFQDLNIGTAKIPTPDRRNIAHYGIDIVSPSSPFSVADYQSYAKGVIADIAHRGQLPILVGGTGLWIRALIQNYLFSAQNPQLSQILRRHIRMIGEEHGWQMIRELLKILDPASYEAIAPNDHQRLVRALEVLWSTGKPLPRAGQDSPYHVAYWVVTRPLRELHQRIAIRTQRMIAQGLPQEVLNLLHSGITRHSQALSAIGYKETVDWAYGLTSDSQRDALIILHTRQYAKRQLTWFRSEKIAHWLDLSHFGPDRVIQQIVDHARETFALRD